jgi:hypothetical protein
MRKSASYSQYSDEILSLQQIMEKITKNYYRFGGLVLVSEFPLPGLAMLPPQPADVSIQLGNAPSMADKRDACEIESGCLATPDEYCHTFPGIVTFYVRGAEEIVVQPLDSSRLKELHSLLYSVIFAVMFHRRGLLPLHASAVAVEGRVFGFLGKSGAGKSTLAAHLELRGYPVTADDLLLLTKTAHGVTRVTPCAPWLKLWEDAFDGIGRQTEGLEPIAGKDSKFMLPLSRNLAEEQLPLAALFLLESSNGAETRFTRLEPAAAVAKLMLYVYPILLIHKLGQSAALFQQCAEILEHVPVFTFSRPWNSELFDEVLDRLKEKFAEVATQK